ncbi:hypothetical protein MICA_546 [Micavibrio aeruginosavorus ARL-13]|uniref:Uncharacterized protein n=2 Tax=Micavibrio aeruginosavorus TaxID=349221 RepID=G2KLQ3_MICAA|nr:hypothetical protein MICA_546 [Micavibrio aeruginosavorus ARL-13]
MLLATPVLSDAATLSASTYPASLPVGNLKRMPIGEVCRFIDPENAFIQIDLGTEKAVNLIALLGHNGSSRGYARVRAADVEADLLADPDYDSGNLPLRSHQSGYDETWASGVDDEQYGALDTNHFILHLDTAQNYRYWRIDMVDTEISYLDVGRLYMAKAFQPVTNMDYGVADGFIDPSTIARMVSGKNIANERPKYRFCELKLSFASEQEMYDIAFEIDRLRGTTRDVLFINDPSKKDTLQKRTIYGLMKGLAPIVNANFQLFEKSYRIEEIIE